MVAYFSVFVISPKRTPLLHFAGVVSHILITCMSTSLQESMQAKKSNQAALSSLIFKFKSDVIVFFFFSRQSKDYGQSVL